jgi:hypothetical protein
MRADKKKAGREFRQLSGSVLNSGARLYEPQHIPMQSKPLRVADPRSENKSGHSQLSRSFSNFRKSAQSA